MKNDGLNLFVRFALGAVQKGLCADGHILNNMIQYLKDGKSEGLEKKIKSGFKTAWPHLEKIAERIKKTPLDLETVSIYVLGSDNPKLDKFSHNRMAIVKNSPCSVFPGIVERVYKFPGFTNVEVRSGMGKQTIKFVSFPIVLRKGDKIAFHWGCIVTKISELQYRRLSE